jgi:broad specificity phosphatase PhoE
MDELLFGRSIDPPLDENGERQALATAERLARESDPLIEASPRQRTLQTARAIAALTHAEVVTTNDLDEVDFGRWGGQPFFALAHDPQWHEWNAYRETATTPAGDSIPRIQARVARHLHRLLAAFPTRTIVLVTHAEIIRSTLLWVLRMPASAYDRIEVSPSSISTLLWRNGSFTVSTINERVLQ